MGSSHSHSQDARSGVEYKFGRTKMKRLIPLIGLAVYVFLSVLYSSKKVIENFAPWNTETETNLKPSFQIENSEDSNTPNSNPNSNPICLDLGFDNDMDHLLSKYDQVFLLMPAKGAGTSLNHFTGVCMASTNTLSFQQTSHISHFEDKLYSAFTDQLQMPSLVTGHVGKPKYFRKVIEHATKDSLIIYSHREESNRLPSAIKQVVTKHLCHDNNQTMSKEEGVTIVNNQCQVTEEKLGKTIKEKRYEIGDGVLRLLTCELYQSIKDNRPNLVFMHYTQASRLQKLLAKHHCPDVTEDVRINVGAVKQPITIVLGGSKNSGERVDLNDWIKAKSRLIEYAFATKENVSVKNKKEWIDTKEGVSCQATTRDVEDLLLECPSQTLQVSGRSYKNRTIRFPF